ncbi:polysaccharide biosynthesis tyrosine autokinase [Caenimonas koreensis DSM 17982]|uniref:Polysaccharide biosynthesis tyrosine autokinase n=1 Tax=Caenimonas koreensis DSM 17982 TaxID=1121255 RepID=A0A844B8J8_9BURK|nr:polysaccharide biosynthesis tyrosine autokinase [Caenimonas koreensis]MRD46851.1 polysaccharide biosynthesis tyrosine autokinase [Caenimonas koreensis DSM 17982]
MGKTEHIPPVAQRPPSSELALRQPYLLQTAIARQQEEEDEANALTLADLLQMVLKHKWTLLLVILISVSIAGVNTFLLRPTYRATAVLQIERAPARIVDFNQGGGDVDQMAVDESVGLKTQYELLRSRSLAERVIDDMQLDRSKTALTPAAKANPAPASSANSSNSYLDRIISGYRKLSTPSTQDAQFLGREAVVGAFLGALSVDPIPNSRLVRVSVDNADPMLAARVANATVQTFVSLGQERRIESSSYAKVFLEDQIKQVKGKLEESERRLQQYAQQKQILALDDKTNVVNQSYMDFATALSKAEQDRIRAEAMYNEVKANPERALQAQESKTLQTFKEAKAKLEVEYQQNLRIYKPDYPKMVQIRAQITQIDDQIKAEHGNVQSLVKAQFDAAAAQERQLRERLNQTRKEVLTTQDNSIDLNLLRREVDTNRQIYDSLLQRLKQIGISSNLTTNNISIVDAATPPLFPYKPNLQSNLVAGLGIGVFLGLCLIFVLEYMDDSIKFPEEVERVLGVPLMGVIPVGEKKRSTQNSIALDVHGDPRSSIAEAYRSVRTALQFSTSHGAPTRLLITSTTRDEGKSTTALALAINFTQMGHHVLLVDGDMRNPSVHKMLGISNDMGLSNLLSAETRGEQLIQTTTIPKLSVLTAGPPPPNPVDLLMGPKLLQLLDKAGAVGISHVIVDGPPILGIADSIVLGNQIQDILFVVRAASTRKSNIRDALRRLRLSGLAPRGTVMTFAPARAMKGYGAYYGYGVEPAAPALPRQSA